MMISNRVVPIRFAFRLASVCKDKVLMVVP